MDLIDAKMDPKSSFFRNPGEMFPSRSTDSEVYSMNKKKMGVALIINISTFDLNHEKLNNRKHTEKDIQALKDIFGVYKFEVRIAQNLQTQEFKELINKVAEEDHSGRNCIFVMIMSHGNSNGVIYTRDSCILVDDLTSAFTDPQKCPSLVGKPKIFIIQACRGSLQDVGALFESHNDETFASKIVSNEKYVIPTLADLLIYFSSAEGYPSFKNNEGSWLMQAIADEMRKSFENQEKVDLMTLFLRVNRFVAYSLQAFTEDDWNACKQMPVIVSMLTKSFILEGQK